MKIAYLKEHIRALFTLQLFHFNAVVSGVPQKTMIVLLHATAKCCTPSKNTSIRNFLDPSSLESLSRNFGLNEFKLKLGFKTLFETSPIRYLQHKRLTYALSLLRDTDKTIKEISHEIGYAHAANFTTAFVRAFGNSPQSFRGK